MFQLKCWRVLPPPSLNSFRQNCLIWSVLQNAAVSLMARCDKINKNKKKYESHYYSPTSTSGLFCERYRIYISYHQRIKSSKKLTFYFQMQYRRYGRERSRIWGKLKRDKRKGWQAFFYGGLVSTLVTHFTSRLTLNCLFQDHIQCEKYFFSRRFLRRN